MEERNMPRRPRREKADDQPRNESLVYGKNPGHRQAGTPQQAAPYDRHREPSGRGCLCQ